MKFKSPSPPAGHFPTPTDPRDRHSPSLSPSLGPQVPIGELANSLHRAYAFLQEELGRLRIERADRMQERSAAIDAKVQALLPDLSAQTWQKVQPLFAQMDVQAGKDLFAHRKTFGLFVNKGYQDALHVARTLVRARLDQGPPPQQPMLEVDRGFAPMNQIIAQLDGRLRDLLAQDNKLSLLVEGLERTQRTGQTSLPESAVAFMQGPRRAASPAPAGMPSRRQPPSMQASRLAPAPHPSMGSYASGNPDLDLWLYFLLDVPTSGRTLLLDALGLPEGHARYINADALSGQGGSFGGGGSSGDFASPDMATGSVDAPMAPTPSPEASGVGAAVGVAGAWAAWDASPAAIAAPAFPPAADEPSPTASWDRAGRDAYDGLQPPTSDWHQAPAMMMPSTPAPDMAAPSSPFDFTSPVAMDPLQSQMDTASLPSFDEDRSQAMDAEQGHFS